MKAVLAIAIEDRVDLWFRDLEGTERSRRISTEIPEKSEYCTEVHDLLRDMLGDLCTTIAGGARELFSNAAAVVVSSPGVIEAHRKLLQIPLWNSDMAQDKRVHWTLSGETIDGFDFREVLSEIGVKLIQAQGKSWSPLSRRSFEERVYVVNDATACAAFEHSQRNDPDPDFLYIKAHNGINVGIIQPGRDGRSERADKWHPEAGHGFPRRQDYDFKAGFEGICPFHESCYEGYMAAKSFVQRALDAGSVTFEAWRTPLNKLKLQGLSGQKLDNAFLQYLLGDEENPPGAQGEGVKIIGHYVGLLALQLSLPLAPKQIVIGGRMATAEVIDEARENILDWVQDYPSRRVLTTREGLAEHIVPSVALESDKDTIEVQGAMAIAVLRAQDLARNHSSFRE